MSSVTTLSRGAGTVGIWLNLAARALFRQPVLVAAQRCSRARSAGSTCSRCTEVCPADAVRLDARGLHVDTLSCEGCGLCQGACWNGAFALRQQVRVTPITSVTDATTPQTLVFTCSAGEVDGGSSLPCLGALDPGRLAEAAAGRVLLLSPGRACEGCRLRRGLSLLQENVEVARRFLKSSGVPGEIRWEPPPAQVGEGAAPEPVRFTAGPDVLPQDQQSETAAPAALARRELFSSVGGSLRRAVAEMLPPGEGDWLDTGQRLRRLAERWGGQGPSVARSTTDRNNI